MIGVDLCIVLIKGEAMLMKLITVVDLFGFVVEGKGFEVFVN